MKPEEPFIMERTAGRLIIRDPFSVAAEVVIIGDPRNPGPLPSPAETGQANKRLRRQQ